MKPLPRATSPGPIVVDGAVWNRLCEMVERSYNMTVAYPLQVSDTPSGRAFSVLTLLGLRRLKIDSNRTRGGGYKAYAWNPPTTTTIDLGSSGAITEANLGVQGQEVHAINLAEMDQNTHALTGGTPKAKIVWGVPSVLVSSGDTLPIYDIFMYDWESCST